MEKIQFTTAINASAEKVWNVLFGSETYSKWTEAFALGSAVETDWKKGSKALFLDGKGNGMVARIEESIPYKFMSIKHLGELKDGEENLQPDWGEALENYTLIMENQQTILTIDMDITEDWRDYFEKTWPEALKKVKAIAESK